MGGILGDLGRLGNSEPRIPGVRWVGMDDNVNSEILDAIIIGAGMTGLTLARALGAQENPPSVLLLEKSKGLGGRLATRRGEGVRFDHGIPLILDSDLSPLSLSADASLQEGATAIPKSLGASLRIEKNVRVTGMESQLDFWQLRSESGGEYRARNLILTAPLPQAIELLESNGILVPEILKEVTYDQAIVALIEGDAFSESEVLTRFAHSTFLTLTNEQKKGISDAQAWTLTFSPEWSERHFELDEASLKAAVLSELKKGREKFDFPFEVKKWRYSRPRNPMKQPFWELSRAPGFFLAGDSFSGNGGNSHLRNAIESGIAIAGSFELGSKSY